MMASVSVVCMMFTVFTFQEIIITSKANKENADDAAVDKQEPLEPSHSTRNLNLPVNQKYG